jgi:hypothetical protein
MKSTPFLANIHATTNQPTISLLLHTYPHESYARETAPLYQSNSAVGIDESGVVSRSLMHHGLPAVLVGSRGGEVFWFLLAFGADSVNFM